MTLRKFVFPAMVAIALIPTLGAQPSGAAPVRRSPVAQNLPFALDGKPVYVQRQGTWQEAILRGYNYNSRTGFVYSVQYMGDRATESNVPPSRIMTLADAQARGIAKTAYAVDNQVGIQQMVAAHNTWRKKVGVPPLRWSPQLATYAQTWANQLLKSGKFEHRPNSPYGENLAWAQGQQFSPERVVNLWGEEVKDYNYGANTCKPGKMCGHYTQVVWKNTTEVGCGVARGDGQEVWVCNYNPPGNYRGQKPY